ncbi:PIN domain-containing protein [archaeon]|nr:PIN domain-containing protein [archaeon]
MDIIIDANVLFSILIKEGKTEEIFFKEQVNAFAPEFLLEEFRKYEPLIREKTGRRQDEFAEFMDALKRRITIVSNKETEPFIARARKISPDPKDAEYLALALKMRAAVWSNDKRLKQQKEVSVYSTEQILMMI